MFSSASTDHPVLLAGRELLRVVHEDDRLLVINKPAGLVCHPTKTDEWSSLVGRVRLYLGAASSVRLIHRLDRETSGLVLAAKTVEAAGVLGKIWESRAVQKTYLAIVHGTVAGEGGIVDASLGKDDGSPVAIKDCVRADGVPARTEFAVVRRFQRAEGNFTLLRVTPLTGRKHQIRLHVAHVGHPIVGDKIYGGDERLYLDLVAGRLGTEQMRRLLLPFQALHAERLAFEWQGQSQDFRAVPEPWFTDFATSGTPHST